METPDPERMIIFDTTLRDGEQSPGISLNVAQKLEIARALEALGVDVIEAGFPAASHGDLQAVSAVASAVASSAVCALARCHEGDIREAEQALRTATKPRMHVFIATSPIHRRHKLKLTAAQVLQRARQGIRMALEACPDVQFSAEDATRTEPGFLSEVVTMAVEAGVRTVNIPDTVGYTTPVEYAQTIESVCRALRSQPQAVISVHCHDDLGMAVANSLAGVAAGARQVECTINGIGERAGNAALEEIVMAVRTRHDRWPLRTGIESRRLTGISGLVSRHTGFAVPPNKAIVGANAFAHESGIHQHGVLGDTRTYEIMRAEEVGASTSLVLGKHSGRHAFENWLHGRGVTMQPRALESAFQVFKAEADRAGPVDDRRILAIARAAQAGGEWRVLDVRSVGAGKACRIELELQSRDGRVHRGCGAGTLPEAAAAAVRGASGIEIGLLTCTHELQSIGDGTQASARVEIRIADAVRTGVAVAPSEAEALVHALVDMLPAPSGRLEVTS